MRKNSKAIEKAKRPISPVLESLENRLLLSTTPACESAIPTSIHQNADATHDAPSVQEYPGNSTDSIPSPDFAVESVSERSFFVPFIFDASRISPAGPKLVKEFSFSLQALIGAFPLNPAEGQSHDSISPIHNARGTSGESDANISTTYKEIAEFSVVEIVRNAGDIKALKALGSAQINSSEGSSELTGAPPISPAPDSISIDSSSYPAHVDVAGMPDNWATLAGIHSRVELTGNGSSSSSPQSGAATSGTSSGAISQPSAPSGSAAAKTANATVAATSGLSAPAASNASNVFEITGAHPTEIAGTGSYAGAVHSVSIASNPAAIPNPSAQLISYAPLGSYSLASTEARFVSPLVMPSFANAIAHFIVNGRDLISSTSDILSIDDDFYSSFTSARHLFQWGLSPGSVATSADLMEGLLLANASALADVANSTATRLYLETKTLWQEGAGVLCAGILIGSYAVSSRERQNSAPPARIPARIRCVGESE